MLTITGIYKNGQIILDEQIETKEPVKVIITFIDEILPASPKSKVDFSKFSFKKSRAVLKDLKGSLSDAIIEERRTAL